jgi:hypothetical protein
MNIPVHEENTTIKESFATYVHSKLVKDYLLILTIAILHYTFRTYDKFASVFT